MLLQEMRRQPGNGVSLAENIVSKGFVLPLPAKAGHSTMELEWRCYCMRFGKSWMRMGKRLKGYAWLGRTETLSERHLAKGLAWSRRSRLHPISKR